MFELEHPFVVRSLFLSRLLHGIIAEACSDIYRNLDQIPLYRKMSVDIFLKIHVPESCFIWSTCCFPPSLYLNRANKFDSIPVSLQTSDTTFAARCRKSLSPMLTKPPFLQFMLSWISNLLPHGQNVGIFVISQQYRKLTQSHTCRFDSSKPRSVTGSIVSQFDTTFSVLILTSCFFSFINLWYQFL